jgi:Holliday junction resolvase RusA-like endonuclease
VIIAFTVAGPPKGKGRPRVARSGHVYTPEATRNYEALLRLVAQQAMAGRPPLDGPVRVTITATFAVPASWPRKRREAALSGAVFPTVKPDFDNCAKLCDGINGVVWLDDKQVIDGRVIKIYGDAPSTRFEINEL